MAGASISLSRLYLLSPCSIWTRCTFIFFVTLMYWDNATSSTQEERFNFVTGKPGCGTENDKLFCIRNVLWNTFYIFRILRWRMSVFSRRLAAHWCVGFRSVPWQLESASRFLFHWWQTTTKVRFGHSFTRYQCELITRPTSSKSFKVISAFDLGGSENATFLQHGLQWRRVAAIIPDSIFIVPRQMVSWNALPFNQGI